MKNVINKKTKTKRQRLINDLFLFSIKNMVQYLYILNLKISFLWLIENSNVKSVTLLSQIVFP
jgi:hypothetical protein